MENKVIEIGKRNSDRAIDDVELIVNEPKRQRAIADFYNKRKEKALRKMFAGACLGAIFALIFCFLWCAGWMVSWLAYPLFAACSLFSAFRLGAWLENVKIWGFM